MLSTVVNYMKTVLAQPEEAIINVDDEDQDIYFVIRGFCAVNLRDHNRKVKKCARLLSMGSIFGEVNMMYE